MRGQEYKFQPGSLKSIAESAVLLLDYTIKTKSASVTLAFPDDLPDLNISTVHMRRAFVNMLANSLSFVPERGKITVSAALAGNYIELEIADNGPGFPPALLKEGIKAFNTTRKESGGTGLGLYVCSRVMEQHRGEMALANSPGGGAIIRIKLPVV